MAYRITELDDLGEEKEPADPRQLKAADSFMILSLPLSSDHCPLSSVTSAIRRDSP